MKYTLLPVSIVALFISAAHAVPEPNNMPGAVKQDAEIEGLLKRLKEDLAKVQDNGDGGGSMAWFESRAGKDHGS